MASEPSSLSKIDSILTGMDYGFGNNPSAMPSASVTNRHSRESSIRAFDYRNQLIVSSQFVLSNLGTAPIAIVLGSGLGAFSEKLEDIESLPYSKIPFLPQPTVKGHSGKIIMGYLTSKDKQTRKRIMCFAGRLHSYEGYPMFQVTFCARLAYLCGVHTLILTNAAGGCIPNQQPGSVVILSDFIRDVNYTVLGHSANDGMFGVRHMKCDKLLDASLTAMLVETAKEQNFPCYSGTYWWCMGPCYETASQIRFSIKTGAAAVGMSTVPSILAARNIGLRVAAMSLCTNVAAGLADEELNHAIVVQNANAAAVGFGNFVEQALLKINDPSDYDKYQYAQSPNGSTLHHLKLNLSRLAMNIDTASFGEYIFPRKYLGTYSHLYKDIVFIRKFLAKILNLNIDMRNKEADEQKKALKKQKKSMSPHSPVGMKREKQFQAPIDFTTPSLMRNRSHSFTTPHYHPLDSKGGLDKFTANIQNRDGPIPIWILHDPFRFNTSELQCPVAIPLKTLFGFDRVSTSSSARNAILNFGFDQHFNLIVVIVGLELGGFSFDEANYIINTLYGVLGHKNLYFTNMFYAFPTQTMYCTDEDEKKEESIPRGQYALIKDSVDFKGGFPRFPRPLFPPNEVNTSDCYIRMKYGVFGNTKTTDSQVECLKGFKGFFDNLNRDKKTNIYSYAFWPGPNFPTLAELNISDIAGCELSGISNPFMTPMCRQLGHDGYSVAYVGSRSDFDDICKMKGSSLNLKNVTGLVFAVSSSIITFFKSSACLYSPASMNRSQPSIFNASSITDRRLFTNLSHLNVPYKAPQFQVLHSVNDEWSFINEAAEWLSHVWNFNDHKVSNALFSSFSHMVDPSSSSGGGHGLKCKVTRPGLVAVNLSTLPGWKEHYCGGYPYSHYHWNNDNPFEWTLKIFRYDYEHEVDHPHYYIVVAPHFFTNTKLHPQRFAYMTSFYKYTPRFWNLSFIVRVLWKLGVKNVCFLSHLIGNDCSQNKELKTLPTNSVVMMHNYIECARWNILTGPNDDRMGPRFTPITEPIELSDAFGKVASEQQYKFEKQIPSVITVHVPSSATISSTTAAFYGKLGYQTSVLGLIPCIQTAQHLGLKKLCVGITDYTVDERLQNCDSFNEVVEMIERMFSELEPKTEDGDTQSKQRGGFVF